MLAKDGFKILLTGITGNQGGSVLSALERSSKPYSVTGITRDTSKPGAKALVERGVRLISLSLSADNSSKVAEAFKGHDAVFAMTNFWEHGDKQREIAEGKMMADAAKAANVGLVIYAGLPNYSKITNGKYVNVDHFDGKAEVEDYAASQGVALVSVQPAMYMENFVPGGPQAPRKGEDGVYRLFMPAGFKQAQLSLVNIVDDYGLFVQEVLETKGYPAGSTVLAVSDQITGQEFLDSLSEAAGRKIDAAEAPLPNWIGALSGVMGERVALEFGEMLACHFEYGYYGGADPGKSWANLARKPTPWAEFAKKQDWSKL